MLNDMKKRIIFLSLAASLVVALAYLTGCVKNYSIQISTNNLWFDVEQGTQTLEIIANCKWTVIQYDDADWYTIDKMNGKNDGTLTITVDAMDDADYRSSKFVISSPSGHVRRTIFVSQNKVDVYSMVNKVYGCMIDERWNTDYYGQMVEDSYKIYEFNPYDTATGYLMYFFENGQGVQRDHHTDTIAWWSFTYSFVPDSLILHIDFETIDGAPESYAPNVLTASDSLYRFMHEFKPNFWERADMRKVATIQPEDKAILRQKASKRRKGEPIFISE